MPSNNSAKSGATSDLAPLLTLAEGRRVRPRKAGEFRDPADVTATPRLESRRRSSNGFGR